MKLALTGHRPDKLGGEYDLKGPVSEILFQKLQKIVDKYKPTEIISGMALGADTIWALVALENKIPLTAAIPFEGQEKGWPQRSKNLYELVLSNPLTTKVYVCDPGYSVFKMMERNKWMVDNCDKLIAVWDGSAGGTGNCVKYAKKVDREIIRIFPPGMNMKKIVMNFKDGDGGRRMRPEFAGKSTMDLIKSGDRTGTTRDWSRKYNVIELEIGEPVMFFTDLGDKVTVEVTKPPYPVTDISASEWSRLEGWDESLYKQLSGNYYQFQYKLIHD